MQGDYVNGFAAAIQGADDCEEATRVNNVPLVNKAMDEIDTGFQYFGKTRAAGGQRGLN
jgi:hypothetical protein